MKEEKKTEQEKKRDVKTEIQKEDDVKEDDVKVKKVEKLSNGASGKFFSGSVIVALVVVVFLV